MRRAAFLPAQWCCRLLGVSFALCAVAGCKGEAGSKSPTAAPVSSPVERLVLRAIAEQRSERTNRLDQTALVISPETSQVIPGLVYYRGVYMPRGTAHMESVVFVAQRGRSARIIRTATDFALIAGAAMPDRADAAMILCAEIARTVGRARTSTTAPVLYENANHWQKMGWRTLPAWGGRVTPPVTERTRSGGWKVQFWMSEPGQMTRYLCSLSTAQPPVLTVVDSILGGGFLPNNP